jgi:hypothetical protein
VKATVLLQMKMQVAMVRALLAEGRVQPAQMTLVQVDPG